MKNVHVSYADGEGYSRILGFMTTEKTEQTELDKRHFRVFTRSMTRYLHSKTTNMVVVDPEGMFAL